MNRLTPLASKVLSAFHKRNQRNLRKLNDEILKGTAMECDTVCFDMAVFSYVLSKIVSKPRFLRPEYKSGLDGIERALSRLVERLDSAEESELLSLFQELERAIAHLEEKDPRFVVDLVTKGKLKMAATFYAQGMSLGVAAEMTGLEKQEILDYAGETMMFDRFKNERSISERMRMARKVLSTG
ncbi:MAG: hypothetical protein AB1529_05115 [Candidatus Micrarchaeota archaeon]